MKSEKFRKIIEQIKNNERVEKRDRSRFLELVREFEEEYLTGRFFRFDGVRGVVENREVFEKFVEEFLKNHPDIEVNSKKEAIEIYSDSKKAKKTLSKTIFFRKRNERVECFFDEVSEIKRVVAVENLETLFKLDFDLFNEENFIYIGGFSSTLIREFLKDKEVLFFVDFDFAGIKIFESFKCKSKDIFVPDDLEERLKKFGFQKRYLDQLHLRNNLKLENKNAKKIFEIVNRYAKGLDQEAYNLS